MADYDRMRHHVGRARVANGKIDALVGISDEPTVLVRFLVDGVPHSRGEYEYTPRAARSLADLLLNAADILEADGPTLQLVAVGAVPNHPDGMTEVRVAVRWVATDMSGRLGPFGPEYTPEHARVLAALLRGAAYFIDRR